MTLAGLLAVTAVAVFVTLQSLKSAHELAAKPLPAGEVQGLAAYLGPLPDSSSLAQGEPSTMVVARDPFGSAEAGAAPRSSHGNAASAPRPKSGESQWIVSSILLEGARRSAIVNNVWVTIGDVVGGGAKVTAIEPDYVIVTDANGVRHTVSIQGGE